MNEYDVIPIETRSMQNDLKIIVVGPPKSGKTEIADILSAASKGFQGNTKPTVALRILEFSTTIDVNGMQSNISIQLWDTSGEEKYSAAWPAIAKNADGVMLVYNANDKNQGRLVENYFKKFAQDVSPIQCLVVAHRIGESEGKPTRPKLPKSYEHVQIAIVDIKESTDSFFDQFNSFLGRVQQAKLKSIEEKERQLIGEEVPKKKHKPPAEDEDNDDGGAEDEANDE